MYIHINSNGQTDQFSMTHYFAPSALLPTGWKENVRLKVSPDGLIETVESDASPQPNDIILQNRVMLPAPANLHSHGFQRALAGLTEFRSSESQDSFWSWRKLMYAFLEHITPEQFQTINEYAQMEMLQAGYASVGEFHYVHNQKGGTPYSNPAELANRISDAAQKSGIGLTLLPVFYAQGGVDGRDLAGGQLRFKNSIDSYNTLWSNAQSYMETLNSDHRLGVAPHSLRAASRDHLHQLDAIYTHCPVHIHIAEQIAEIEEIKQAYGMRPVSWLLDQINIDPRWCLVHATHLDPFEKKALAESRATAGLCPVTEANLGDGIFDAVTFQELGGAIGVGTDSNISISLAHELRLLEYSQRLQLKGRALLCSADKSAGRNLFDQICAGGAQSIGRKSGQIAPGYLADLVTLDTDSADLYSLSGDYLLDSWIFASSDNLIKDVFSAGRHVVKNGQHLNYAEITTAFKGTIQALRSLL